MKPIYIIGRPQMTNTGTALGLVTRVEAKTHCKIDGTDDDTYIDSLIEQVINHFEHIAGTSIIAKSIVLTADVCGEDFLPYSPVTAITEVKYRTGTATDGTAEYDTLTGDDYQTDGIGDLLFKSNYGQGRYLITYTAGYSTLPASLKLAILNEIAFRYQNRGDQSRQYIAENPGICEASRVLLMPYKRVFGI